MDEFRTLAEIYEMEIYEINLRVGIGVPCTTVEVKMTQTHTFIWMAPLATEAHIRKLRELLRFTF